MQCANAACIYFNRGSGAIHLCAPRYLMLAAACGLVLYHFSHGRSPPRFAFLDMISDVQQEAFQGATIDWMLEWYKTKHILGCTANYADSDRAGGCNSL